jgi:putative ABC transport system substrate-binding protein
MNRRELLLRIGGLISAPITARAQQQAMPVIGVLSTASPGPYAKQLDGFRRGLSENGFVEGKNAAIGPKDITNDCPTWRPIWSAYKLL